MNRFVSYTTLLALATSTPVLFADLSAQVPAAANAAVRGNCDLLASNTVRATFVGMHDLAVQTINDDAPTTAQVAVFEVIDLLGYKKYNRLGDGQLTSGTKFTVAMSRELPGQPADIVDTISQMQPGEEAVLKIDHLYLMNGAQGEPLRVCSRMARRAAQPAVTTTEPAPEGTNAAPAPLPDTLAPLGGAAAATGAGNVQFSASSTSVSVTRDASGQIVQTRTESKFDPASGQMKTRMFINGTEVDPQTRQPLPQPVAAPAPAAEQAPAPAADKPAETPKPAEAPKAEENGDDTVVEHVDAPAPQPAPEAAAPSAPAPAPAAEEGEGF